MLQEETISNVKGEWHKEVLAFHVPCILITLELFYTSELNYGSKMIPDQHRNQWLFIFCMNYTWLLSPTLIDETSNLNYIDTE